MYFDLRRIDSDELLPTTTLEVDPQRVSMIRRLPVVPDWRVNQVPRRQLVSARVLTAEKIAEVKGLNYVAQRAVSGEARGPEDRFLLLLFDVDGGQAAWVLKGSDKQLLAAEQALLMPSSKLAEAANDEPEETEPDEPPMVEDPATRSLKRALTGVGIACTVLGFLFLLFGRGGGESSTGVVVPASEQPQTVPQNAEGGQAQPPPGSPDPPATATPGTPIEVSRSTNTPLAAGQLSAASAALTRHLDRRPRVYRIVAEDQTATFEIYAAGRSDVVERWLYRRGSLVGPDLSAPPPLEGGAFVFNDVRLGRVPAVVSRAKRLVNDGDPALESASVVIRRNVPGPGRLRMRVDVSGPARSDPPPIFATPEGKIVAGT